MFFILACLFIARRYGTSAAPVAPSFVDPLANYAPIFTRDECSNDCSCPDRTVWDIVWSCLATTFAVTWVSVHPNVPWLEEKSLSLLKRRIFLMCVALLAPEVMIMWAFKQWRGAVMAREMINNARPKSCMQWTMTHAHFLQMGGFKVNYTKGNKFGCWDRYGYETKKGGIVVQESFLHFSTLRDLLEKQLIDFPDTTAKEIEDRSKGDALSKGVALLQITWFIIQLIARALQHLTITEIELSTAALAGLNSIMYLFWWNKPLDVRCPIIIRTKELERLLVEKGRNPRHGENKSQNIGASGGDTDGLARGAETWTFHENVDAFRLRNYLRNSLSGVAQGIISALATHLQHTISILTGKVANPVIESQSFTDGPKHSRVTRLHFRRAVKWIWTTCTLIVTKPFYLPYLRLLMFLPMHCIFIPMHSIFNTIASFDLEGYSDAKAKMDTKPALQLLFDERDMKWIIAMMFFSQDTEVMPFFIFSALAGAAFGSIHCAAWHFDFPSAVEQILWRTASLTIVGLCLFIIAISPVYKFFVYDKWRRHYVDGTPDNIYWTRIKKTVETPAVIIYPVARLSLLILALLSLRRLPPSAFDTVVWTKFIPHI